MKDMYPPHQHQRDFMAAIQKLVKAYDKANQGEGEICIEIEFGDGIIVESDLDSFLKN